MHFFSLIPTLILPLALPTTLAFALAPNLVPRAAPVSNNLSPPPPQAPNRILALNPFVPRPLNDTQATEPTCLPDRPLYGPPSLEDCNALIEQLLLSSGAMINKRWHGSGESPLNVWSSGSCIALLFVSDPSPGKQSEDVFQKVELAVTAAKIVKACLSPASPGFGGELMVGPKKQFILMVTGLKPGAARVGS